MTVKKHIPASCLQYKLLLHLQLSGVYNHQSVLYLQCIVDHMRILQRPKNPIQISLQQSSNFAAYYTETCIQYVKPCYLRWTWMYCFGARKSGFEPYNLRYRSPTVSMSGIGMTKASAVPYTCCAESARCKWCSCTNLLMLRYDHLLYLTNKYAVHSWRGNNHST